MIYIYLFLFSLVLGKIKQFRSKKRYLLVCFFQFFIFWTLRGENVGKDTFGYLHLFDAMKSGINVDFELSHYEIGFKLMYRFLTAIGLSSRSLLFVCGAIIMIGFAYFIYKNIQSYEMATVLFAALVFPSSLNIMRQYVAIAIAINFVQFLRKEKYMKAVLLIVIGSLFHSSVLLFLMIVLCYKIEKPKLIIYVTIPMAIASFAFIDEIIALFGLMSGRFAYYMSESYSVFRWFRVSSFIVFLEFVLIMCTYLKYYANSYDLKKKNKNGTVDDSKLMRICVYAICGNLIFAILYLRNEVISRVMYAMDAFLLAALPLSCYLPDRRKKQLLRYGILGVAFVLMVNSVYNSGNGIVEYTFYFLN